MTSRRRPHPRGPRPAPPAVAREDFPALAAFLRGYLHEDLEADHGTVAGALAAFAGDATAAEVAALDADRRRLGAVLAPQPLRVARDVLARTFGSAWSPATRDELEQVLPGRAG